MADQPTRGSPLRADLPTLEPDDAFLARLSSLAAAGAPRESTVAPRGAWRIGLAAASVAVVLLGAAWLSGLGQPDGPDPTPAPTSPATSPASPDPTGSAVPSDAARPTPITPGAVGPDQPSEQPTPR